MRPLERRRLELVPKTPAEVRAQLARMTPEERAQVSVEWLAQARVATEPDPWVLGFTIRERQSGSAIGTCGFKGRPDAQGTVEIAYGIDAPYQGRGFATEAATAMTAYAFQHADVRLVRAHTFAEGNASARVLSKCGFRSAGQVADPDDGLVWRWERRRHTDD
jgi:RimJ/RimL family protein N-acetyltransferase